MFETILEFFKTLFVEWNNGNPYAAQQDDEHHGPAPRGAYGLPFVVTSAVGELGPAVSIAGWILPRA